MSTFNGYVEEFPEITIDFFRRAKDRQAPLAAFLSHVHSDHLQGLESYKAPFIYCSPATRELLLCIEKHPDRMNFHNGILEVNRRCYKHLDKLLKPIPLNTPTLIELRPGRSVKITLLDANHCAGAVMFLIQDSANAILYTGDIRSEPWWVNNLLRNPVMLPFTSQERSLDKIYLDTTFATRSDSHRIFPSKAFGLEELLSKVRKYPSDTVFHFNAWTFGYEEVWVALSNALGCQIHVDPYRHALYRSLKTSRSAEIITSDYAPLVGFQCGNHVQEGCLTNDPSVRLHSCEFGTGCPVLTSAHTVFISPIISRNASGRVIPELGAFSLDLGLRASMIAIFPPHDDANDRHAVEGASRLHKLQADRKPSEVLPAKLMSLDASSEILQSMPIMNQKQFRPNDSAPMSDSNNRHDSSARRITFPYSRHSSFNELCDLVNALRPLDVYPCVVEKDHFRGDNSIKALFGQYCSGTTFAFDAAVFKADREERKGIEASQQAEPISDFLAPSTSQQMKPKIPAQFDEEPSQGATQMVFQIRETLLQQIGQSTRVNPIVPSPAHPRSCNTRTNDKSTSATLRKPTPTQDMVVDMDSDSDSEVFQSADDQPSTASPEPILIDTLHTEDLLSFARRRAAYDAAQSAQGWNDPSEWGGLISSSCHFNRPMRTRKSARGSKSESEELEL